MKRHKEKAEILLKKAKQDVDLLDAVISNSNVADDIFGFHAQQAAEKYLKALLSHFQIAFKHTHNLRSLMELLGKAGHPLPTDLADLDRLTPFGTLARYEEGDSSSPLDRKQTRELIRKTTAWVERSIQAP